MKNESKIVLAFIAFACFMTSSCIGVVGGDITSKCGDDIDLGRIDLTTETTLYFPYTGREKIILKNANNEELTLQKLDGPLPVQVELTSEAANLCVASQFDSQNAVYKTTRFACYFQNTGKRQMSFNYAAEVKAKGETKSTLGIFDSFSIGSLADSDKGAGGAGNAQFRGDTAKVATYRSYSSGIRFVADTTIGGKNFKNVMYAKNSRHSVCFAKGKGLIAMKFDDELWLVDRVE
jgi:hypothetical protein